jgi:hypothetical protein
MIVARRLWTAGLALAMLAACSGPPAGAGHGLSSPPGRVTSAPGPAGSHPKSQATRQQLEKIVVRASDLPRGWEASPYTGPDQAAADAVSAECLRVRNTAPDVVAEARSSQYVSGKTQIGSIAASYRSERDLDVDFGTLANPRLSFCSELLFRKVFEALGFTIESVSARATPPSAGSPANVVGFVTVTAIASFGGRRHVLHDRTAAIRGPLIEAQVEIASIDAPIPQGLMNTLVTDVASRAAAAS